MFVFMLLTISVGMNVILAWRVRQMAHVQEARFASGSIEGSTVPPLSVRDMDGNAVTIGYGIDIPTAVYAFSSSCEWCNRNIRSVQALATQGSKRFRFLGIALGPVDAEYLQRARFPFPVYTAPSERSITALHLRGTPQTTVISNGGVVLRSWAGAFGGDTQRQIQAYFGVHLPGIASGD